MRPFAHLTPVFTSANLVRVTPPRPRPQHPSIPPSRRATPATSEKDRLKTNEKKWGKRVWKAGWTGIPNLLLENQRQLDINPTELNVLILLLKYWWDAEKHVWPSKKTIADFMGVNPKTVQRATASLKTKKLISIKARKRKNGGFASNNYSFDGLVERLRQINNQAQGGGIPK